MKAKIRILTRRDVYKRQELEKIISYTGDRDVVTGEDILEICTTQTQNKIFDMVRAVTEKNQKRALDLYLSLIHI